jgi:thiamine pyrophosphokinase
MGILPLYSPAVITTHGLEWDITDWDTRMGGQVSTSNHVVGDRVDVETDAVVLFTIEVLNGEGNDDGV